MKKLTAKARSRRLMTSAFLFFTLVSNRFDNVWLHPEIKHVY
ncbi:hypothetical protein N9I19_04250 [Peribacillus sp. CSMR9]|nr:hypothetical protein [Peribacillus sp. CSMR9]